MFKTWDSQEWPVKDAYIQIILNHRQQFFSGCECSVARIAKRHCKVAQVASDDLTAIENRADGLPELMGSHVYEKL